MFAKQLCSNIIFHLILFYISGNSSSDCVLHNNNQKQFATMSNNIFIYTFVRERENVCVKKRVAIRVFRRNESREFEGAGEYGDIQTSFIIAVMGTGYCEKSGGNIRGRK